MPTVTLIYAALLTVVGVGGYLRAEEPKSPTALIPAAMGTLFAICAVIALLKPSAKKHAMHAAAALALVGVIATISGVVGLAKWLGGEVMTTNAVLAAQSKSATAVLSVVFLGLCIKSFRDARRRRQAAQGGMPTI